MIAQSSPPDSRIEVTVKIRHMGPFPGDSPVWSTQAPGHLENAYRSDNALDTETVRPSRQNLGLKITITALVETSYSRAELLSFGL